MNKQHLRRLPAEWEQQSFVQLTWPHEDTDWRDMLDEAVDCFVNIAKAIVRFEKLLIVCKDVNKVLKQLGDEINYDRINLIELPSNDTWARDHGAITVYEYSEHQNSQIKSIKAEDISSKGINNSNSPSLPSKKVLDFSFNGWGMKFASNYDNLISSNLFSPSLSSWGHPNAITLGESNILAEEMNGFWGKYSYEDCREFILEGGSIESDGKGIILTTSECLLSLNRNHLSKQEIELKLKKHLGAEKILWLNHGYLAGDDTDSHVDTLARLCPNNTICYVKCSDESDEHYNALKSMEDELKTFTNIKGEYFNLIALPMSDAIYDEEQRLPATYANFLIINNAVLAPTYNCAQDEEALKKIGEAFPDREIIGIDCNALIKQHGSLHCVTMQFPE